MLVGMLHTLPIMGVMFMEGATQTGERVLIISAENPDRIVGFDEPIAKHQLERFHLESYRADHVLRFDEVPFDGVVRGAEPPDFEVITADGRERLDCAALADERRRLGYRLMEHLRGRLIAGAGDRDFSGIEGCVLSVWFGESLEDLPPKRWDDTIIDPLLDAMTACQVDHRAIARLNAEIAERGFPQVMPPVIATGHTPDKAAGFVANVLLGPLEGARFSTGLGFDVQLSRPAELTATDARIALARIVQAHDQPDIDHLLLTVGGPDRFGDRYPGEEAVGGFLLQQADLKVVAAHLEKVTIHLWFARQIAQIPVSRP